MERFRIILFILLSLLISNQAFAVMGVKESDGDPDNYYYQLIVGNGTLTDNGDGTVSYAPAGAAHNALTLAADAGAILGLSDQELNLDTETANYVFAGPTTGAAADPTFRGLVDADIPDNITITEADPVVKAINGIVKSNGSLISAASAGTDYMAATLAKDLVTTAPLTGGTDNILPGADSDVTVAINWDGVNAINKVAEGGINWDSIENAGAGKVLKYVSAQNVNWDTASATVGDGDKGDVSVSSGTWTIDPGVVNAGKIAAQGVNSSNINWPNVSDAINVGAINWDNIPNFEAGKVLKAIDTNTVNWDTVAAGAGSTQLNLPIYSAKLTGAYTVFTPPTADACTQGAQIDAGDGNWRLLFDATTDECATWQFVVPDNYASTPKLIIDYAMTSATANEVEFEGCIMCVTPGDGADIGTASFSNVAVCSDTVPGTAGYPDTCTITLTDDSCAAGDIAFVVLSKDADDATNDDATGDTEVDGVAFDYV